MGRVPEVRTTTERGRTEYRTSRGFDGVVHVPRVLGRIEALEAGEVTFAEIAAPPMTISADTTVSDAIDQFQAERQELALVLADGDVVGLLTATDVLESVMGQLEDPLDRADRSERSGRGHPTTG